MTDKEFKTQERRIRRYLDKWAPLLIPGYDVTYEFYVRQWCAAEADGRGVLADTLADWRYVYARIRWDCVESAVHDDAMLEKMVIHELTHVPVNEMREWGKGDGGTKHEERVVSDLTNALLRVYKAGEKAAKKVPSSN